MFLPLRFLRFLTLTSLVIPLPHAYETSYFLLYLLSDFRLPTSDFRLPTSDFFKSQRHFFTTIDTIGHTRFLSLEFLRFLPLPSSLLLHLLSDFRLPTSDFFKFQRHFFTTTDTIGHNRFLPLKFLRFLPFNSSSFQLLTSDFFKSMPP